jgi:hypothetical protein
VQRHTAEFIAHTEAATGSQRPRFVKDESDAFLECGILAHGFLRLRCGECGHDRLLAFSCKRRGFCPSCDARRMSQTAAHQVNRLIDGFEGKLTSSKWAAIARCSPDTALRDLTDLSARGVLRKSDAGGRSTSYGLHHSPG